MTNRESHKERNTLKPVYVAKYRHLLFVLTGLIGGALLTTAIAYAFPSLIMNVDRISWAFGPNTKIEVPEFILGAQVFGFLGFGLLWATFTRLPKTAPWYFTLNLHVALVSLFFLFAGVTLPWLAMTSSGISDEWAHWTVLLCLIGAVYCVITSVSVWWLWKQV